MLTVPPSVRSYKVALICGAALAAVGLGISLVALQSDASGASFYGLLLFGFLFNLQWLPLCYLGWFAKPKVGFLRAVKLTFFWLATAACGLFWVSALLFVFQKHPLGI